MSVCKFFISLFVFGTVSKTYIYSIQHSLTVKDTHSQFDHIFSSVLANDIVSVVNAFLIFSVRDKLNLKQTKDSLFQFLHFCITLGMEYLLWSSLFIEFLLRPNTNVLLFTVCFTNSSYIVRENANAVECWLVEQRVAFSHGL